MVHIMAWDNSDRRERLPDDWELRRSIVLRNASYQCEWYEDGKRCPNVATDCDHIIRGDDHSLANLQALCPYHHNRKSSREGNAARKAKYSPRIEPHPGYRD
jgi:5-methylcytosine-specific restriction enzyme A